MSEKKEEKKKYGLKIQYEMFEVFQKYINENPKLGYRSVSEFLNELIRTKAKEILESEENKKEL